MACCFMCGKNTKQTIEGEEVLGGNRVRVISYSELRKATHDFSGANKIGEGGFGSVFRGRLKEGTIVAVKVLSANSRQGIREFITELTAISDIMHENLITLVGYCAEGSHRILVYNYLENNNLAHTLLGSGYSSIRFNWRARVKIAVGVARGLAVQIASHFVLGLLGLIGMHQQMVGYTGGPEQISVGFICFTLLILTYTHGPPYRDVKSSILLSVCTELVYQFVFFAMLRSYPTCNFYMFEEYEAYLLSLIGCF